MDSSSIRQAFCDYFVKQGHTLVPSSGLIPVNDQSLLFTNAGMVQFKDVFLGQDKRPYTRAVSAQRCLRAGGKHNDLDNVGYTARHHTFFEMLGNFSFGDYFKREAIHYAWDFLTQVLAIPASRLWVTVYLDDDEAAGIWQDDIGIAPERIIRCGEKDNFWSMGDTGPCGPCSEIFYDHGPEVAGGPPGSPDAEGDRFIEVWNLVFMQFNRDKNGVLHPLPQPSVDTGMGLERIAAVVQAVHSNYEIDTFDYLIKEILKTAPGLDAHHPSLKVLADHIRACAFLLADGVIPSNEGRGYVLRRIIRRAVRHGHGLGLAIPFFHRLLKPLGVVMGEAYPELLSQSASIEQRLLQEEQQFARTLDQGMTLLREYLQEHKPSEISGELAFKLYDTYGFPLDLTADIAREQGLTVDIAAFNDRMQLQRTQSQQASKFELDSGPISLDINSEFQGYRLDETGAQIEAIVQQGQALDHLNQGAEAAVILDTTPFYAESGGQAGDKGLIISDKAVFQVDDTQVHGSSIWHYGRLVQGTLSLKQKVHAKINLARREAIRLNHSATHLLHAALAQVLGPHVRQKGSLVEAELARFDFIHDAPLSAQQLLDVEKLVNQQIRDNHEIITEIMSLDQAKQTGAAALFGEKYADEVRVLSMGEFSKELCGGTHAARTGDLGLFKITAEYGVAAGVRRIEWVTGAFALLWVQQRLGILDRLAEQLKTQAESLDQKIELMSSQIKRQDKDLLIYKHLALKDQSKDLAQQAESFGDKLVLIKQMDNLDPQGLRAMLDELKASMNNAVIVLFAVHSGNLAVVAGLSKALVGKAPSAAELVKRLCGKGGGREDMAQGGGPLPEDLADRLEMIKQLIVES